MPDAGSGAAAVSTVAAATGSATFVADVLPILDARCGSCHGDRRQRGGLALLSSEAILAGGDSGSVLDGKKAMGEVFCLMKLKEIEDWREVPEENFELIRLRNGFKTEEDFRRAHDYLTVGDYREWWSAQWAQIQEQKCEE